MSNSGAAAAARITIWGLVVLNLKKLFLVEIASIIVIVVVVAVVIEVTPYLASSKPDPSIGVYNEKEFARGTVTLGTGQTASAQFNYTTFDPAILVIDLTFQNWQKPGYLSMYCNGRGIGRILATPNDPTVHMTVISVSGKDWVKPWSIRSFTYGNEVSFVSESENGYEGTFSYQVDIRGSR